MTKSLMIFILIYCTISCSSKSVKDTQPNNDSIKVRNLMLDYKEGKSEFSKFCTGCHIAPERHAKDQYIFDDIFERLPNPSETYFMKYIQDTKSLKNSGDKYAINAAEEWNSDYNHNFKDSLSEQSILKLITYIKIAAKSK